MQAFTLVGGATETANSQLTSGVGRSSEAINLPLGENMLRVTSLGSPDAQVRIVAVRGSKITMLNEWSPVGASGLVLQAPNDVSGAWIALRTKSPGVVFGLTLFNTPPAT